MRPAWDTVQRESGGGVNRYDYLPQNLVSDLREFANDCIERIDGGEECRGADSRWTAMADAMERAADLLEAKSHGMS
jgi:hypothetical protein